MTNALHRGCAVAALSLPVAAGAPAQAETPPALAEAIDTICASALDADRLDWDALSREIVALLGEDAAPDVYRLAAIEAYADPHASYLSAEQVRAWQTAPPAPAPDTAESDPEKTKGEESAVQTEPAPPQPEIPAVPWGQMLDGGVGYVGLPPCTTGDPQQLQAYARALREQIVSLDSRGATRWVVDLRLDGGGNVWPMLAGLAPLLGDGPAATSIGRGPDGEAAVTITGLTGDAAWLGDGVNEWPQFTVEWEGPAAAPRRPEPRWRSCSAPGP